MQPKRLWPILLALAILVAALGVARYFLSLEPDIESLPPQMIQGYGPVASLPKAAQQPRCSVVLDATADAKPGDVNLRASNAWRD